MRDAKTVMGDQMSKRGTAVFGYIVGLSGMPSWKTDDLFDTPDRPGN